MRWIIASSLKFRLLIIPFALVIALLGITQLPKMPVDVLPEFTPTTIEVQTEALGLSAAEVEQLVTVPLEADLLNGVAWLDEIRSESVVGLSSIELVFEPGTDILRARQMVQERLTQAHALPHVSKPPVMLQPLSSTNRVMMIGLSSKDVSLIDMSVLARWRLKPRLMGVPGVANVSIWGQRERQLQVQVDPAVLAKAGVSLDQVIRTTGNALAVSPLTYVEASTPGTGGFIDTPNQRLPIRHVLPINDAKDLAEVPVEEGNPTKVVRLGDVTNVVEDHQPLIGDALVEGSDGLILVVEKAPSANTVEVTRELEAAVDAMRAGMTGITAETALFRPATFIEQAMGNLGWTLLGVLAMIILLIGLAFLDWRAAVVALVAIPLSLAAALLVLNMRGATLNVMVLAGIVAVLGVVIDDAVVGVDALRKRLTAGGDESPTAAVVQATLAVRGPLGFATVVMLAATAPFFFFDTTAGYFSRPFATTFVLAMLASLIVALTVTPAAVLTLAQWAPYKGGESTLAGQVRRGYSAIAGPIGRRWQPAAIGAAVVVLAALAAMPFLGERTLLPTLADRNLLIRWDTVPGTSRPEMMRLMAQATNELRLIPGVETVGGHAGRAIGADQVVSINSGEIWVTVAPDADYTRTITKINNVLGGYPGLYHDVRSYPAEKVASVDTGVTDPVVVRVFGQDLGVLQEKAELIRKSMANVDGLVDPRILQQPDEPTVEVKVDLQKAQQHGLKPGDVRRAAATMVSGLEAGNLFEEQKVFEVVVWGAPSTRNSVSSLQNLMIDTPEDKQVKLSDVAEVRLAANPTVIRHDSSSRAIDVVAGVQGRSNTSAVAEVEDELKKIDFPIEYHAEVLGEAAAAGNEHDRWLMLIAAALIAGFLLIQAAFHSWRLATLLFATLPVSLAGGVLTTLLAGGKITFGVAAGFLAVLAVAVRQGIVLIREYQRAEGQGLAQVTASRVMPVLVTALATGLAMVPMAFFGWVTGFEIVRPLAVVVIGGLITSTAVTLFLLPVLYAHFAAGQRSTDHALEQPAS